MTEPMDTTLRSLAGRLLAGTGLTGDDAEAVACGRQTAVPEQAEAAATALRDGWSAAERAGAES
jgi:hypothetical protein